MKNSESFEKSTLEKDVEKLVDQIDAEIWEFDDEFEDNELLFAIILNK